MKWFSESVIFVYCIVFAAFVRYWGLEDLREYADLLIVIRHPYTFALLYIGFTTFYCAGKLPAFLNENGRKGLDVSTTQLIADNTAARNYTFVLIANTISIIFIIIYLPEPNEIVYAIQVVASVLMLQVPLVYYRIRRGYYGGDEEDAREIIGFALRQADTGGGGSDGTRRPLLTADDLSSIRGHRLTPEVPGSVTQ